MSLQYALGNCQTTDAPNLGKSTYCVQLAELQVISMIGRVALGSTYLRTLKWLLKKRQNIAKSA